MIKRVLYSASLGQSSASFLILPIRGVLSLHQTIRAGWDVLILALCLLRTFALFNVKENTMYSLWHCAGICLWPHEWLTFMLNRIRIMHFVGIFRLEKLIPQGWYAMVWLSHELLVSQWQRSQWSLDLSRWLMNCRVSWICITRSFTCWVPSILWL